MNILDQSVIPEEPELKYGEDDGLLSVPKSSKRFRDILAKDGVSPRSNNSPTPTPGSGSISAKFSFRDPLDNLQTNIADIVHKMKCTANNLWSNERSLAELDCKITMLSQTLDMFRTRVADLESGIRRVIKAKDQSQENLLSDLEKLLDDTEFRCEIREVSRLSEYSPESRQVLPEAKELKLLSRNLNLPKSDTNISQQPWQAPSVEVRRPLPRGSVALENEIFHNETPPLRKRIHSSNISPSSSHIIARHDRSDKVPNQVSGFTGGNDNQQTITPILVASRHIEHLRFNFLERTNNQLPLLESLDGEMSPVLPRLDLAVMKSDDSLKLPMHGSDPVILPIAVPSHDGVSRSSHRDSRNSLEERMEPMNVEIHEPEPERVVSRTNEANSQTNSRGSRRKTLIRVLGLKQDYPLGESSAPRPQVYSGVVTGQQSSHTIELRGVVESKHKDGVLLINLRNPATLGKTGSRRMSDEGNTQAQKLEGFMKNQAEKSPDMSRVPHEVSVTPKGAVGFSDYLLPRPLIKISQAESSQRNRNAQDSTADNQKDSGHLLSSSRRSLHPADSGSRSNRSGLQSLLATMKRPVQAPVKPPRPTVVTPQPHLLAPVAPTSTDDNRRVVQTQVSGHQKGHVRNPSVKPGTFANPARFRGFREAPDI